ncbi:unnamed protein product [Clonostachys solani]|uniref:Uncharacterized protein n=1 Tax=Clonostachys solani TaxID=160281 RepID=A0A9N9ZJ34_9HYPO|nr:unnamed protein product [Clonostachys solani]
MRFTIVFFGAMVQLFALAAAQVDGELYQYFILCCDNYPASSRLYTPVYHDRDHLPSAWVVRAAAGRHYHGYGELCSNHILRSSYSDAASRLHSPVYHNSHDFPTITKHLC